MSDVIDFVLDLFSRTFSVMRSTSFSALGFNFSLFSLLLSLSLVGLLISALVPFASRSSSVAGGKAARSSSERIKKGR